MTTTRSSTSQTTGLPEAGTWAIDTAHSSVEFVVRHLMMAKVRGSFTDFSGTIEIGETPQTSSVQVEMQVASVSTRDAQRDGHLTSPDFFDAEAHPTISFRSTAVRRVATTTQSTGTSPCSARRSPSHSTSPTRAPPGTRGATTRPSSPPRPRSTAKHGV